MLEERLALNGLGGRMLFHFTSLNLERLAEVVHEQTIYFSRPAEFNDPFELSPHIDMGALEMDETRLRWVNDYEEAVKHQFGADALQKAARSIAAARESARAARELFGELPRSLASILQQKYRVYCLSTELRSVQMWSHYAAKHQGLAYEFLSTGHFFASALHVDYVDNATPVDPEIGDGTELFLRSMLTKATPWGPENEYRLFATDEETAGFVHTENGRASFPPDEFTGIFVGCRMPEACVRAVINEAMRRHDPIPVYRMQTEPRLLTLTANRIFPTD